VCRSSRFGWDVIFVHTNMLPIGFKPRDDELDPMDPAAYSDTPRYSLTLNDGRMPPECCKPKFTTSAIHRLICCGYVGSNLIFLQYCIVVDLQ